MKNESLILGIQLNAETQTSSKKRLKLELRSLFSEWRSIHETESKAVQYGEEDDTFKLTSTVSIASFEGIACKTLQQERTNKTSKNIKTALESPKETE